MFFLGDSCVKLLYLQHDFYTLYFLWIFVNLFSRLLSQEWRF